jgi:hypothetical protein
MNIPTENLNSEVARRILFEAKESGVSVENYLEAIANGANGDAAQKMAGKVDLSESRAWLRENQQKFVGQWVVLDGDKLIGAGDDPRPIVEQARASGVEVPFVKFIEDDSESFTGGWL